MPDTPIRFCRPALLLATGLLLSAAHAQTPEQAAAARAGTLKQVQGELLLGAAAGQSGDPVRVGERIFTGARSGGSFVLKDGTVVTLGPQTEVSLVEYQFDSTTQNGSFLLNLIRGSARIVSGAIGKVTPERFRVQTPTAVVGIRGTDFIVETQAVAATRLASAQQIDPTAAIK